uniref:POU class 2 homeobox associating factor 1 n=1 Tax=Seriola lalandi dorsalis TaxID=1841481 RepID=A0A3B4WB95_SERLL
VHWPSPSALVRSRPYQGVRVRDPVKELLRRKRSLEPHSTKTTPLTANVHSHNNQSSYTQGISSLIIDPSTGGECAGWRAPPPATGPGLQPWASPEYNQQDPSAQPLAYPATTLTADLYMQTLCPSYTMLTYTHAPLLTNFGTIPVAPAPAALPQMELPDSGLTYLPWAQPLTTISTMPNPGVQFAPGSAALSGSPLVHMPLSMSLTTMIPQLEAQGADPQPQILDLPQQPESPNLLDKLLEDHKEDGEEEDKDSYSGSLFIPNV